VIKQPDVMPVKNAGKRRIMMGESVADKPLLKIFENDGTFQGFKTYYLIEVPR
jgi:hypothetical protein